MSQWIQIKLGEIVTLNYGKALKAQDRNAGSIPVYSSGGLTGWHDCALINDNGIIVGRKGTVGKSYLTNGPFWCIDTAYYILPNPSKYHFIFLFYLLKTLGLEELNEDSAVPGLNRDTAYSQILSLPPLPEQKAIASVLSSLDDKIDLLHRKNKTLESMAETLFRQWFIVNEQEHWLNGTIEDLYVLQRGFDLPSNQRVSGKFNLYAASGLNDNIDSFKVDYPTIITGRSGVIGKVYYSLEKSWPLNTTLYIKDFKISTFWFAYFHLKTLDLASLNSGSAVPTLNRNHVHSLGVKLPPKNLISKFEDEASVFMINFNENLKQILNLENLRDTLLPKLMSGEVRVQYAEEAIASVA